MTKTIWPREGNDLVAIKRYRLTLSVWIDCGADSGELQGQRRTAEMRLSPELIDTPEIVEKSVIKKLCEEIMRLEGIEQ